MPKGNILLKTRKKGDARNLGNTPQKRWTVVSHAFLALSDICIYVDTVKISPTYTGAFHQDFNNVKKSKGCIKFHGIKGQLKSGLLFAVVINLAQKEHQSAAHVYLTARPCDAILNRTALNVTAYTALARQHLGCIIQRVTWLLITEKHIFTE